MGKSIVFLFVFILTFISCQRDIPAEMDPDPDSENSQLDTIRTYIEDWNFKIAPLNGHEFLLSTKDDTFDPNAELLLLNSWQPMDTFVFKAEPGKNYYGGNDFKVNHTFNERYYYGMIVRHKKMDGNKVYLRYYVAPGGYRHSYVDGFTSQKIASASQILDFDITPSRNFIYYIDYVNNDPILYRLSLKDEKSEEIVRDFHIDLRAVSDEDVIVFSGEDVNGRYLDFDSCAIMNYNIKSKEETFIAWGLADRGRFSHVIDNSILVTGPDDKSTLINLSDGATRSYPIDFRYIDENSFDHIYHGRSILNSETGEFETPLPFLNQYSGIVYFDDKSGYYIVEEGFADNMGSTDYASYSRLMIYKDQKVVFELPFMKNRQITVPKLINLEDGQLIIHQQFDFSNKINYDGYYLIDIEKKVISLIKNDSYTYLHYDFFLSDDKKTFYSISPVASNSAIYKMSLVE